MDGLLTTKDFFEQKQNETGTQKVPESKKIVSIKYRYLFPQAPMGQSQTTVIYKNKPFNIKMIDGVFETPEKWSRAENEKFGQIILTLGFKDVSLIINNDNTKEPVKPEEEIKPKPKVYKIGHPENTKENKINGKCAISLNGKDIEFDCKDGVIETDDKNVFDEFIKSGWYQVSIKDKKTTKGGKN